MNIKTLGELKKSGYTPKTIKEELRQNLIARLEKGNESFRVSSVMKTQLFRIRKEPSFPAIIFYSWA